MMRFYHIFLPTQITTALDWFLTVFTHTASFGDSCREAPDGELIQPKIEPISEEIKYKMFHFMIDEGDLNIVDGDTLTRIQVYKTFVHMCILDYIYILEYSVFTYALIGRVSYLGMYIIAIFNCICILPLLFFLIKITTLFFSGPLSSCFFVTDTWI